MAPFNVCPVCGGELVEKPVEKLLRGGANLAVCRVQAEICLHCGGRLYSTEIVREFERIRKKLERNDTKNFAPLGRSYQVL